MEAGSASDYAKGLEYVSAARRVSIAIRGIDPEDAEALRKASDQLMAQGLKLLRRAVKPGRNGEASTPGA